VNLIGSCLVNIDQLCAYKSWLNHSVQRAIEYSRIDLDFGLGRHKAGLDYTLHGLYKSEVDHKVTIQTRLFPIRPAFAPCFLFPTSDNFCFFFSTPTTRTFFCFSSSTLSEGAVDFEPFFIEDLRGIASFAEGAN
jgi:hypothetical protein